MRMKKVIFIFAFSCLEPLDLDSGRGKLCKKKQFVNYCTKEKIIIGTFEKVVNLNYIREHELQF